MKKLQPRPRRAGYHHLLAAIIVLAYIAIMNGKQEKTLVAVFRNPVSGTIDWADVESLFVGVGAKVIEGNGSRVRFEKDGVVASFHRPHPAKEAKRYQIRDARDFLIQIGIQP